MLGKLIKHEFKATGRIIPFIYLSTLLMLLLSYIAKQINVNSLVIMSSILTVVGIIACVIMTLVVIITRFNSSMYKQEGYLTNTLPVSGNSLIFSKALVSVVWMLISYGLSILLTFGLFFIHFQKETFEMAAALLFGGISFFWQVAGLMLVSIIISSVLFVAMIFFSIATANTRAFQKYGGAMSFVIFIVVYLINEVVGTVCTLFIPLGIRVGESGFSFVSTMMFDSISESASIGPVNSMTVGIAAYIWYVVLIVALFYATAKINEKKANVK